MTLKQAVTACLTLARQFVPSLAGALQQKVEFARSGEKCAKRIGKLTVQLVANGAGGGEGVQALIEPAKQGFLAGFRQIGHMDVNISALTDPVQTTDALFQQVRMERQVKANQVLRKLKIAAFTTNF